MNTKQITKPIRFFLRYLFLISLTIGASLTLGLLSFSGMFLLFPILGLAVASFILAIAYEGEIFWQNLEGVYNALFSNYVLKRQMVREFLLEELLPYTKEGDLLDETIESTIRERQLSELKELDNSSLHTEQKVELQRHMVRKHGEQKGFYKELAILELNGAPSILIDYVQLTYKLKQIELHEHEFKLNEEDKKYKRLLIKKIKRLEVEFAKKLMALNAEQNAEDDQFTKWCKKKLKNKETSVRNKYYKRYAIFTGAKVFSAAAGGAIFVGTAYLLFDAFVTVAFLEFVPIAALPIVILTLSALAATAYTFITYYSITSMINNRSLQEFVKTFIRDVKEGTILGNIVRITLSTIVIGLAIIFTVCTAGTWWTIGQNLAFIIEKAWLISATVILFLSTLAINLFNSICTWFEMRNGIKNMTPTRASHTHEPGSTCTHSHTTDSATTESLTRGQKIKEHARYFWNQLVKNWQSADPKNDKGLLRWNLPRLFIQTLFLPIDFLLFIAHVISIGVTGDQINGLPQVVSVIACAAQEAVEDSHRFGIFQYHDHRLPSVSKLLDDRSKPGSGHEHGFNLPRRLIQIALSPLFALAIVWDWVVIARTTDKNWKEALSEAATRQSRALDLAFLRPTKSLPAVDKHIMLGVEIERLDTEIIIRPLINRLASPLTRDINLALQKKQILENTLIGVQECDNVTILRNRVKDPRNDGTYAERRQVLFETNHEETTTQQGMNEARQAVLFTCI